MIARGYVQVVPKRNRRTNEVVELRLTNLTKTYPRNPEPGAMVLEVRFEMAPEVFSIPRVSIDVDGTEDEFASAVVPVPVPEEDGEDTDA